ncbi:MAG TPA: DUF192 domain-containing protein, partial [Candidatus Didemnitutus sp.]|nr:DUF192 domain-containing protein [Candidatus Didemnitutus sp.]
MEAKAKMFSRLSIPLFLTTAMLAALTACGAKKAEADAAPQPISTHFAIKVGERTVQMQIAARSNETERGLMFVQSMGADEGMLFVFSRPQQMGF